MATNAFVIKDKNSGVEGFVSLTGENEVTIDWADDRTDSLSVDEFNALTESEDYEVSEVELDEAQEFGAAQAQTDAMRSIKTHSTADKENGGGQDDGNPKTKWDYMRSMIGNLAQVDMDTLARWNDEVLAQVGSGQFSAPTNGNDVGNKNSIDMKPSGAEGHTKNINAPYMPGLGENVLVKLQKEEQDAIFGETELTEDAKVKITTLFESAVALRLTEEAVKLQEAFEKKLEEKFTETTDKIVTALDEYLEHAKEEFMHENQIAIESSLRSELVMDFIDGLKGLFTEHYIDIPEDKVSVVEALVAENDTLKNKLNEAANQQIANKKEFLVLQKEVSVAKLSEGLTIVEKDKLRKAMADVEFVNEEEFSGKVKLIKESFLGAKSKESNILVEGMSEEDKGSKPVVMADPALQAAFRQMVKN